MFLDPVKRTSSFWLASRVKQGPLTQKYSRPADHDPATFPGAHRTVTFVGRPFPLDEAPEHFAR